MKKEELEIELKKNKSTKEIASYFGISNIHYWLHKYKLTSYIKKVRRIKNEVIDGNKKKCLECNIIKYLNEFHFRKESNNYRNVCKKCATKKCNKGRNIKFKKNKNHVVEYKGSCCEICKIKSNYSRIYDLHHKDPSIKEFNISNKRGIHFNKYKKEIDKCHLLCSNCHREVHGGLHPSFLIKEKEPTEYDLSNGHKKCNTCNIDKPLNLYYKNHKFECKKCFSYRTVLRLRKIKQQCVNYKGGKCVQCGYNKYIGAIEFHHLDPTQKDFGIAQNQKNFGESHKKELDKCVALCSNCHRIEHERLKSGESSGLEQIETSPIVSTINKEPQLIEERRVNKRKCIDCDDYISKKSKGRCMKCSRLKSRKVKNRPKKEDLENDIKELGYVGTGKKYGVSDNSIRKWLKRY